MAGIFPQTGTTAPNTQNAEQSPEMKTGCEALYFPANCNPRFNPLVMNAVISELVNAINVKRDYDCSRLDNLALVLQNIASLCNQPTYADGPDTNDFIAGCFDGTSGKVSVSSLITLLAEELGVCSLPTSTSPDTNDFIGMCVDGVNAKVAVSDLIDILPSPELNICGLPTNNSFDTDDYVGICVDGNSFKTKIENLLALQTTVPGITRFSGATSIGGGERPWGQVAIADITYPKALRLSLAFYDRTSQGNDTTDYHHFAMAPNPFTSAGYAEGKIKETAILGGGYQFYTYVPQYGALYRLMGGMIEKNMMEMAPTDTLYIGPWTDSAFDDFTTVVTGAYSGTIVSVNNP